MLRKLHDEFLVIVAGGVLGAILSVLSAGAYQLWHENTRLPEASPLVRVTGITIDDVTVPSPNDHFIVQSHRLAKIFTQLAAAAYALPLDSPEIAELVDLARHSGTLDRLETSLGNSGLDISRWGNNCMTALGTIPEYERDIALLNNCLSLVKEYRDDADAFATSLQRLLFEHAYSRSTFNGVVGVCLRNEAGVPQAVRTSRDADKIRWPNRHDKDRFEIQFDLPSAIFVIDTYPQQLRRNEMAKKIADTISRSEPHELESLLNYVLPKLQSEIDILTRFLRQSNEIIQIHLDPRISVKAIIVNASRTPVTIRPGAAITIRGASGSFLTLPVELVADGANSADSSYSALLSDEAARSLAILTQESSRFPSYVTVQSGESFEVNLIGSFAGNSSTWSRLLSAYESELANVAIYFETFDGVRVESPLTDFRSREHWGEVEASNLVRGDN